MLEVIKMCREEILFSVVIPIYKVEQYVGRCIESVLNQNLNNLEIILVDDGSPDRCPEICDEYALKDSRIKVIHKKNGGLSDARNAGVDIAKGKYIIFVDSDDFITENSLEQIIPFSKSEPDIIICDGKTIGGNCNLKLLEEYKKIILSGEEFLGCVVENGNMMMASVLYIFKREFLNKHNFRFKYGILHEDEEFTPRVLLKAKSVIYSGVDFYRYIIREDSITTYKDKRKNLNDLYDTLCKLKQIYLSISNKTLRVKLLDSLSSKYLSKYFDCKGYKYGKYYSHKFFVFQNARLFKTKLKAILFCFSPRLYCYINSVTKDSISLKGETIQDGQKEEN